MTSSQRKSKQVAIVLILFLIIGGIGFLIYRNVVSSRPSLTPPPTANLTPIQVIFSKLFNVENNDYDFWVRVTNPNTDYGSPDVEYELTFTRLNGTIISKKTGSFYILPGQTKNVIDSPLKFSEPVGQAEFRIISSDWQKLSPLAASGVTLVTENPSYNPVSSQGIFAKVGGEVLNNSDFDLNKVDVTVVLLDQSSEPVAVNKTEINTFLGRTTRGFEVTWFTPFVGKVDRVDVEANTNVFENSNFLRTYGGQEKFKQLY